MYKLTFTFDESKMKASGLDIEECYHKVYRLASGFHFRTIQEGSHFECLGNNDEHDMAYSFLIAKALRKCSWFRDSITDWFVCDNYYCEDPNEFEKEDLYDHYILKEKLYEKAV